MYRFYVERDAIGEEEILLSGEDVNHIRNVLRMRAGEEVILCDGMGTDYRCRLKELKKEFATAEIITKSLSETELPTRFVLFQGIPKKDKMELIIQKAVELGVWEIVPVITKRTVVKPSEEKKAKRRERFQAIARAAAMQSMRGIIPEVAQELSFFDALKKARTLDAVLIPYEGAKGIEYTREVLAKLVADNVRSIGIFIGPEGGFEQEEVQAAISMGASCITLGHRILRTETAGLVTLSLLMIAFEI
jgi:16S rRNA (uracil1498-N3)-methyltransferase